MPKEITTKSEALKGCPKPRVRTIETVSGESHNLPCKTWGCPVCGPKRKKQLKYYFKDQLVYQFDSVNLFTFTLRSGLEVPGTGPKGHYQILQQSYKRVTTELREGRLNENRRTKTDKKLKDKSRKGKTEKSLKDKSKNRDDKSKAKVLRTNECHKTGYPHVHCFIDTFIPQKALYVKWNAIVKRVLTNAYSQAGYTKTKIGEILNAVPSYGTVNVKHVLNNKWCNSVGEKTRRITAYILKQLPKDIKEAEQKAGTITQYVTKQIKNITTNTEYLNKTIDSINKKGASSVIKEKIDNIEEHSQDDKRNQRPFTRYWSKSNNLPRMHKPKDEERMKQFLIIQHLKYVGDKEIIWKESFNLYYKEQLLKFKYQTWANLNSIEPHAPPE